MINLSVSLIVISSLEGENFIAIRLRFHVSTFIMYNFSFFKALKNHNRDVNDKAKHVIEESF